MDFYDFRDAIITGLETYLDTHIGRTHLEQGFTYYSARDSNGRPVKIAEKHFKSAILQGLNSWNISSEATGEVIVLAPNQRSEKHFCGTC